MVAPPIFREQLMTNEIPTVEETERAALLQEAASLGLVIDKRRGNDAIREHIVRHRVAKAQAMAVVNAQEAIRAAEKPADVTVRITKLGHNRISRGIHIPGKGDLYFAWKETAVFERPVAEALEAKGFVEIDEAA